MGRDIWLKRRLYQVGFIWLLLLVGLASGFAAERIKELRVAQIGNPSAMDCWNFTAVDEGDIIRHFLEPLFDLDRQGEIHGAAVESWEMKSPTEWILRLRKGMKFHDPEYGELKAEDVVASLDSCVRETARVSIAFPKPVLKHQAEIVDDYTIRLTMPEPGTGALPNNFAYAYLYPKKYLELGREQVARRPIGTGPYRFVEWVPNQRIVVERFDGYWGQEQFIDRIVWRIIPDAFTRKSEFLTGGIDILPFVQPTWAPEIEANPNTRVERVLSGRHMHVILPVQHPPFQDKRVRQALNYAINRDEIVKQLFIGVGAIPLTGAVHPILPEADANRKGYPYDPKKARQLLDEARAAGVKIGKITLYATNDRYTLDKEMGEAVAGYWQAIGLDVEYVHQPRSVLFPNVFTFKIKDPFLIGFGNIRRRAEWLFEVGYNRHYASPIPEAWQGILDELARTATGDPRRIELAQQLDQQWTEYAPWVFLINYVDLYGVNNRVDWKPYAIENRYFLDARPRQK